jgi:hypothetical protein
MAKTAAQWAKEAAEAHTNLNVWHTLIAILEGGTLYGGRGQDSASMVINIAKAETQKELSVYDRAIGKLP